MADWDTLRSAYNLSPPLALFPVSGGTNNVIVGLHTGAGDFVLKTRYVRSEQSTLDNEIMSNMPLTPHDIRELMLALVQERGPQESISPADVARRLDPEQWSRYMAAVHNMAHRLAEEGRIEVMQQGEPVDIRTATGPVRLRLRTPTTGDEPIRFILDVHLGKLARWLRLLGFDTLYRNDYDDPEIVAIAAAEARTILTRDVGIIKRRAVTRGYLVQSTNPAEQLREILGYYRLHDQIQPFHRCLVCNGLLAEVAKADVIDQLEPKTIRYYDTFFQCTNCGKLYWRGTHYERMQDFIAELIHSTDDQATE